MVPQPFAQPPLAAVADTFFYWTGAGSSHVAKYSWSGVLMDSITVFPAVAVTDADQRRMIERNVAGVPSDNRPAVRRFLESVPLPESRAAYGALVLDDMNRLWVQAHADPDVDRVEWVVLDADGQELFRGWMPGGVEVRSVRDGAVLASIRDSQDREGIALWHLR